MTEQDILDHFDFIDGIQKAQMIAIRALLRNAPEAKAMLTRYDESIDDQEIYDPLSEIQRTAMKEHLAGFTK